VKILYLTTHLNRGGISKYILTAGSALRARGHEVEVASSGGETEPEFKENGIRVKHFPIRTKSELNPKLYAALPQLIAWVKEQKIELIHAHTRVTQVLAFWVRRFAGIPYVTTAHGFYEPRIGRRLFPAWGDRVIAISPEVGKQLEKDHRVSSEKVSVVSNGVDLEGVRRQVLRHDPLAVKKEYGIPEKGVVLGIVARLIREKGHEYLIRAFKELTGNFVDLRLLVVGDGRERKALETLVHELNLNQHVVFTGNLSDVSKALRVIDLFVLPATWREGFGLAIVEAMACEKPVVVTKTWALGSVIEQGVNGFLVEPTDVPGLARLIGKLLDNRAVWEKIGRAGRETAEEHFSLDRMVRELEDVYEAVLKK
jgi:glycosyltransferase involved in cell wall biosynthesis